MKTVLILVTLTIVPTILVFIRRKAGDRKQNTDDYTIKRMTHEAALEYLRSNLVGPVKLRTGKAHEGILADEKTVIHELSGTYGAAFTREKPFNIRVEIALENKQPVVLKMENLEK